MLALFLLLVIVAIVPGIVGVVVEGLLFLPFIGIVVFPGALLWAPCECGGGLGSPRRGDSSPNSGCGADSWFTRGHELASHP